MVGSMLIGGIALIGTIFTLLYLPGECKLFYFDFVLIELYYELVILGLIKEELAILGIIAIGIAETFLIRQSFKIEKVK